jgi:hypothetical protein
MSLSARLMSGKGVDDEVKLPTLAVQMHLLRHQLLEADEAVEVEGEELRGSVDHILR